MFSPHSSLLIAPKNPFKGKESINFAFCNFFSAKTKATNPPLMEAVLVPPFALITSQSIVIVLLPNFSKSTQALNDLPTSLEISCALPF